MTRKRRSNNPSSIQRRLIPCYIFLIIVSFFSVFPIFWMVTAATNSTVDIARGRIWFGNQALVNFKALIEAASSQGAGTSLGGFLKNSFVYAITQTLLCIFLCSLAGYGFELYHDKLKDKLFGVLLMAMMVPQVATLIPLFTMMSKLGFLNTIAGFMLPAISTPFMIMMFRQNSRNFPVDILEAARIDGLREGSIFFRMFMPIMKSTYAAAAVITFMNAWNAYMWPRAVMTKNSSQTMQILLTNLSNGYVVDYGLLMMAVLFCSAPTMIIFFVMQKQFAEGITGAVK